jgi:hypothetical protein
MDKKLYWQLVMIQKGQDRTTTGTMVNMDQTRKRSGIE